MAWGDFEKQIDVARKDRIRRSVRHAVNAFIKRNPDYYHTGKPRGRPKKIKIIN